MGTACEVCREDSECNGELDCEEREHNHGSFKCAKNGHAGARVEVRTDIGSRVEKDPAVAQSEHDDDDDSVEVSRNAVAVSDGRDVDGVVFFAPLDGTTLYTLICCMNYSCGPNGVVRYRGGQALKDCCSNDEGGRAARLWPSW